MKRLYLRIYLAVLASIAMSVLLAGVAWRFAGEQPAFAPRPAFFTVAVQSMLPPVGAAPDEQARALARWHDLSGYDLALFDASGGLIARAGPGVWDEDRQALRRPGGFGRRSVTLDDGRRLYAQPPQIAHGPMRGFGWLAALLGIAIIVAICAWPVVRRLTRNLENLESGVAAFGAGDLAARARIRGKDEVARLAATFNETAKRIETLVRANRSLLANASHELRSPLARLRMSIENLGADTPVHVREEVARNVRELDALVDEILTSSRLEALDGGGIAREAIDVRVIAAEESARAGADLEAGPGSDRSISGDPRLLRRLIRNLVENARRYGGGTRVEVNVFAEGGAMIVAVCDRGPGVAEAERERIFEPFYRPPGASERAGGVGLGLALVRQIARAHGGDARCGPRDGGGACFRVRLAFG